MNKNLMMVLMVFILCACAPKKDEVVAVKVGDEYYATDSSASVALADKDSDDKVICRKTAKTGSRLQTRVCTTKKQMELDREEDKRRISDNIQHNSTVNTINKKGG